MRPHDFDVGRRLGESLKSFDAKKRRLPGIHDTKHRDALVEQLLESIHRVKYVSVISGRDISDLRAEPKSDLFDPLKASILFKRKNQIEEAFWLIFIFVHFGKHKRTGWRLARDVYGRLRQGTNWNWAQISANPTTFRQWLNSNQPNLKGHFGNHRKYQSLDAYSPVGTGAAFESYVNWIRPFQTHEQLVKTANAQTNRNPREAFRYLYDSMNAVTSFGRTAKFDYLTMIGKIGLAAIEPGSAYLEGATGPVKGARLLLGDNKSNFSELDKWLIELGADLNVGMQVMEDALCNWQKNPAEFIAFRG